MLATTFIGLPGWTEGVFAIIALASAGYFIVRGNKVTALQQSSQNTVTMMTGEIAALTSRVQQSETEIGHLKELNKAKDIQLEQQRQHIAQLEESVTQRAAVEAFRTESRQLFRWLGKAVNAGDPPALSATG